MSTPTPAQLPTRQQLDEIDALLRRMLSLPPLASEAATPPAPSPPAPTPAAVSYATPTIREVPPPQPPTAGAPIVQEWRVGWQQPVAAPTPSVLTWGAPVPLATLAEAPYDSQPAAYPFQTPPATQIPTIPSAVPPGPPLHAFAQASLTAPSISPILWPLVALNVTFNIATYLLGPLGTWLRGSGRTLLGWLGIGMILAAGVWAAGEKFGYDWPKVDVSAVQAKLGLSR
jgi:hypothetical protein